jgi:hypothetical protein
MRVLAITVLFIGLGAAPLQAAPSSFQRTMTELQQQTRKVRSGFFAIAPLDPAKKGPALAPYADEAAKLVARLEALTPPASLAGCHSDALDGARRATASLNDMLRLYRIQAETEIGPRVTSAARHVDNGLSELETALVQCGAPRK